MAVHEITIGRSGTGKSYYVVHHLVLQWLPFSHNGNYFTNLPLKIDEITEYIIAHYPDLVSSVIIDKIKLMTHEDTVSWMSEKSGPWDFFSSHDLNSARIVIDEIHNYVHTKSSKEYVQKWRAWLGELRHLKCSFECISQYETKVHPLIRHECGLIRRLSSSDDKRDPIFWIRFYDHFQILSKLRGYYASRVWISEYHEKDGKWTSEGGGSIPLVPQFYQLYNSYSAPIASKNQNHANEVKFRSPHPYANLSWSELLQWYFSRNLARILFFSALYILGLWLFVFGGIISIFNSVITSVNAPKKTTSSEVVLTASKDHMDQATVPTFETKKNINITNETLQNTTVSQPYPAIFTKSGTFDQYGRPYVAQPLSPQPLPIIPPIPLAVPAPVVPSGSNPPLLRVVQPTPQ